MICDLYKIYKWVKTLPECKDTTYTYVINKAFSYYISNILRYQSVVNPNKIRLIKLICDYKS